MYKYRVAILRGHFLQPTRKKNDLEDTISTKSSSNLILFAPWGAEGRNHLVSIIQKGYFSMKKNQDGPNNDDKIHFSTTPCLLPIGFAL